MILEWLLLQFSNVAQSTCFEELQPAAAVADNVDVNVKHQHVEDELQSAEQESDGDILIIQPVSGNDTAAARVYHGKSSHTTSARAKQYSSEADGAAGEDALYTVLNEAPPATADQVKLPAKAAPVPPLATATATAMPHPLDCWSISTCVLAGLNNQTIDVAQFCPSSGSSLNVSYTVPVSRYLQAVSLELHFRWVLGYEG